MVKLGELSPRGRKFLEKLIPKEVTKQWLRDIILRKGFNVVDFFGHHSDLGLVDLFDRFIWDNLTEEQQNKVVEALNLIIEEDLFLEKQPEYGYWSDLLDFAILLHKKLPGKINITPFILWKEEKYLNLLNSSEQIHPEFIKKLDRKIETAFLKE